MTGLLGEPYPMSRASYDLTRLRRNGLIVRVTGRNLYRLTDDGLAFAIFYTKVHNRVLRPLMAAAPPTPPPLRAALRTIDQHITARLVRRTTTVGGCLTRWTSAKVLATKDR